VGQKGIFLYHRICAQCHGKKGKGASARALNDREWLKGVDDGYLREITANGLLDKGMPPYVTGVTPALDEEQMVSLDDLRPCNAIVNLAGSGN
jgi:mono/diheme cytochrome c family protein